MLTTNNQLIFEGFEAPRQKRVKNSSKKFKPVKRDLEFKPMFSITPEYFAIYSKVIDNSPKIIKDIFESSKEDHKKKLVEELNEAKKKKKAQGSIGVSMTSRAKFRRRCGWLFQIAPEKTIINDDQCYTYKMKLNFITLTLTSAQIGDDKQVKSSVFKNWIDAIRKRYPGISYVWRAEVQENGRLHFHLMTDHYIPLGYANGLWLSTLRRHGYTGTYGISKKTGRLCDANPVDVEKVKSQKQLAKYVRKYMLKGLDEKMLPGLQKRAKELYRDMQFAKSATARYDFSVELAKVKKTISILKRRKIKGRLWGSSENLEKKPLALEVAQFGKMGEKSMFESLLSYYGEQWRNEYVTVYYIDDFDLFIKRLKLFDNVEPFVDPYLESFMQPEEKRCPFTEFNYKINYTYGSKQAA